MSDTDALTLATRAVQMKMLGRTINQIKPEELARAALEAAGWLAEGSQPTPTANDRPSAHDLAVRQLRLYYAASAHPGRDRLIEALEGRKEFGLRKYGTLLQPFNGRDAVEDAFAEVQDLIVYLTQLLAEQEEDKSLAPELVARLYEYLDGACELGIFLADLPRAT